MNILFGIPGDYSKVKILTVPCPKPDCAGALSTPTKGMTDWARCRHVTMLVERKKPVYTYFGTLEEPIDN